MLSASSVRSRAVATGVVADSTIDYKSDLAQVFENPTIQGHSYLIKILDAARDAAATSGDATKRAALDALHEELLKNTTARPSMAVVLEIFSRIVYTDPQFLELMKPVVTAILVKANVLHDATETDTLATLKKELDEWKPMARARPDSLLWTLLFMHTFPAYRLSNFIENRDVLRADTANATTLKNDVIKKVEKIASAADADAQLRGAGAGAKPAGSEYLHLEDSLSTDVTTSTVLQQLAQLKGLTPDELVRQKIQDRMSRPLRVSDVLVPHMNKALQMIQNANGSAPTGGSGGAAPALKIKALRFLLDPEYNRILKDAAAQAMKMQLDGGARGTAIPTTIDSVRGSIFITSVMSNEMKTHLHSMSKSRQCMDGYEPLVMSPEAPKPTDAITFKQSNGSTLVDAHPLAVYWMPGLLTERTPVRDILEWGSISRTFKPTLLALVTYTLETPGAHAMSTMRMFFFDERKIRRLTAQKRDEFRRMRDGSLAEKANYDLARIQRQEEYGSGDSDNSDASDDDEDEDEIDDEDEEVDDDDEDIGLPRPSAARRTGERIVKRKLIKFFSDEANAMHRNHYNPAAMEQRQAAYKKPLVVEVGGVGRTKGRFIKWKETDAEKHLADGTLQSFAGAIQTLYEYQMGARGDEPDMPVNDLTVVNYTAFVRLRGGHFVYRDPTNAAAKFDMLLTHGRAETGKTVMKFEKVPDVDDDPYWAIQPVRLDAPTLDVSQL